MDLIDASRFVVIALYLLVAGFTAFRAHQHKEAGAVALLYFMSIVALLWALFYISIFFAWIPANLLVLVSRVLHLPTIGVLLATANSQKQRDLILRALRGELE